MGIPWRVPACAWQSRHGCHGRASPRPDVLRQQDKGKGKGKEGSAPKKPATLGELAALNTARFKGAKSASGGAAGFANAKKANLFPEGKYLEDGWVEAPKGKAKKGGGEEKVGCVVMWVVNVL